jgi:phosphatidylinositol alpha-mannosyltransferase
VVIPNPVDTLTYRNAMPFSVTDTRKRIVFLGRLVERKGCMALLKAIKRLVESGEQDFVVDICGKGELEDELKKFVAANRLSEVVTFHGFVAEADKPRYLAGADIAVFPSLGGESFGIVLIEAMAAGAKVVLGGDNPGYATVLRHEQLFNPRSTLALVELLKKYLHNPTVVNEATIWQRHQVKQYDVNIVAAKVLKLYDDALHRRAT